MNQHRIVESLYHFLWLDINTELQHFHTKTNKNKHTREHRHRHRSASWAAGSEEERPGERARAASFHLPDSPGENELAIDDSIPKSKLSCTAKRQFLSMANILNTNAKIEVARDEKDKADLERRIQRERERAIEQERERRQKLEREKERLRLFRYGKAWQQQQQDNKFFLDGICVPDTVIFRGGVPLTCYFMSPEQKVERRNTCSAEISDDFQTRTKMVVSVCALYEYLYVYGRVCTRVCGWYVYMYTYIQVYVPIAMCMQRRCKMSVHITYIHICKQTYAGPSSRHEFPRSKRMAGDATPGYTGSL